MTERIAVNGRFLGDSAATGVGRVARALLGAAQELDARRWRVIAPNGTHDPLVDEHTGTAPGRLGGARWEQVTLTRHVGSRRVLSLANTAPVLARRGIVLVHDLAPLVEPTWFHPRMRWYGRITLAAARRAELVLAVSQCVADDLVVRGVERERLRVVAPAVDTVFTAAEAGDDAAVLARFGIDGPFVLHVGAADPRKDVELTAAAHRAALTGSPHQLVLVGRAHPNLAPVSLPAGPTIVHLPRVDDAQLAALYRNAAVLLYPSRHEGFGLPPLEAQSCGTPAIVSDIDVLRATAGPSATRLPIADVDAWTNGLRAALAGELPSPTPSTRTWSDAASDLISALDDQPPPRP